MTMIAAATRRGSLASDAWNACALPWKLPIKVAGAPSRDSAFWIAVVAWPSAAPDARLKDRVTDGYMLWWLIDRKFVGCRVHLTKVLSGTASPVVGEFT